MRSCFFQELRLAMFLAEPNGEQLWGADVGNAYLQSLAKEKLYIVPAPEFEELQGHALVMHKHSMVQDLREHVGMTSFLIFFSKWISNLQKQTKTYG